MVQARTSTNQQQQLVTQLVALDVGDTDQHVSIYDSALEVPTFITDILAETSATAAAAKMVGLSYKVSTPALNDESAFNCDASYKKLENWASGTKPPYFRSSTRAANTWLANLFAEVARRAGHTLSRADLFHCHLSYDASGPDLLLIFHAREYPSDIEPFKNGIATGLDNGIVGFDTTTLDFRDRNPIYSAATNRIYVPHFVNNANPYRTLIADPDLTVAQNPLFLDSTLLGDCLADISTFPREGAAPFFTIWSSKASTASTPVCSKCNKTHTQGTSTALGRWHYCSQCEVFICNICGKWTLKRNTFLSRTRACGTCSTETALVD